MSQHTDITETHTYIKTHLPGVWDTWLPQLSALPHRWDVMETELQQELVCDRSGRKSVWFAFGEFRLLLITIFVRS